ncbi:acyl-CoA dehydrogenase family protein [Albimonas sp. CAU 1670]|uniref:acyl-CoA dehydrogenase family protein n=1 Tax=Albimonas sp. CAU 1670 TaxID=3032599 RepID=UPI0023DC64CF|nr:acyl-CoA dehydrogenase family protein [Albimonas sp. CAU 1670]MDF2231662.1 acyl-CoA dehydrogenase family protein [Albimonas sp. CAU 1670]
MSIAPRTHLATHEVFNQPLPRERLDLWGADAPLRAAVAEAAPEDAAALAAFAAEIGSPEALDDAERAQRVKPELAIFDRGGRRLDEVRFHPGYHAMMTRGAEAGYAARAWDGRPGGHAAHAAMVYLLSQVEPGVCCPLTMTYAAVPALEAGSPALAATWGARAKVAAYDGRSMPGLDKAAVTIGMAMTEKQGGSDVRANTTRAVPEGEAFRLWGHKWFCSAPMSDAFLTLAYLPEDAGGGLTCFLVPRWTPEGERNPIQLQRLKDKLGNHANASSEIEYHGAWAQIVGEPGRGVNAIIEMVHHTRLDAATAPVGFMRRALDEAAWWARGRTAFQRRLADQPLMEAVLGDLALDWIGSLALVMRVARAFDGTSAQDRAFARIAVAIAKYWTNKRCVGVVYEAMEAMGGVGYVEEAPLAMLYREAPLNSIWEGSGNVICLDVLRTLGRAPEAAQALTAELSARRGEDARYDAALAAAAAGLEKPSEGQARWLVERLALLLQASELMRTGDPAAEPFLATRLAGDWGRTAGTLPEGTDAGALAARI